MDYTVVRAGVGLLRESSPAESRLLAALALIYTPGVGPGDAAVIDLPPEDIVADLRASCREVSRVLGRKVGPTSWECVGAQVDAMARLDVQALTKWDDGYPSYLKLIDGAPTVLFHMGDPAPLGARGVAVVGSRKPSPAGVRFARRLSRDLSAAGVPVVSGLARGIDTAAHEGGLSGVAPGVAVLGTGLDVPYPDGNADLMLEIARGGCVVSEQPLGTPPRRHVFPLRNRLISAFSHAVVVVEAGPRSGALITARWALDQGREVGAVPGFPGDFRSAGTNRLLKQGAFVVESAKDVFAALPRVAAAPIVARGDGAENDAATRGASDASGGRADTDAAAKSVLAALSGTPTDADSVAAHTGLTIERVQRLLLDLELDGRIERDEMDRYTKVN